MQEYEITIKKLIPDPERSYPDKVEIYTQVVKASDGEVADLLIQSVIKAVNNI